MAEDLRSLWRAFRATRDPALREQLIRATIGLVRQVAGRLALRLPPHLDRRDLESSGIPGLLAAIEHYDPDSPVEFAAFAISRIRGAMLDELRSLDPLPRSLRERARQIERAIARLEQQLGRSAEDDEVAEAVGLSIEDYHQILAGLRGGLHVSLDTPGFEDAEGDLVTDCGLRDENQPNPWDTLAAKERQVYLGRLISALPPTEGLVLSLYYYDELTMKEIGEVLGVSESRVSQLHAAAMLRLRARLRRQRVRAEDLTLEPVGTWSGGGH
jgi:RNA polymerase sigma factor for flagellar operon FliA